MNPFGKPNHCEALAASLRMPDDAAFSFSDAFLSGFDAKVLVVTAKFFRARIIDNEVVDEFKESILFTELKKGAVEWVFDFAFFFPGQVIFFGSSDGSVTQALGVIARHDKLNRGEKALDEFLSLRKREGETLGREFTHHLSEMRGALAQLEAGLEEEKGLRAARLKSRLAELLGEEADSKRFQTEMAYVMERSDVTEELARMKSHLSQFESILGKETEAGRKLDFLLQEMHREISTMAAKCEAQAWVPVVLSLKATTEKMRQQAQNIE